MSNQAPPRKHEFQMTESTPVFTPNDEIVEGREEKGLLNGPTTEAPGPDRNISSDQVQKDIDELDGINQKQEERIHKLEAKALQLTNLYFVFQGVILSSISAKHHVECHHWYVPFILSLIAALLNMVSLVGTLNKYLRYKEELDQNHEDIRKMKRDRITRAQINNRTKPDLYKQWKRRVFSYAGVILFVGFSGVILYGCHALLCYNRG
ncbi:hypothetical protein I3843_11G124500 [Carya illinoinensis]|uniref:Uncharacterized protein n=1 Tax=Carya illinoinensis TaxID=32201 RepID=A0A8T1P4F0_CARIL|nr:hypothetical protein I3760_11G124300 [Carya illinoinensis]KAG6636674.1 hypothetical protein CIPAW_11G127200 [Carya illinoinensis]KAG6671026.1 hypothetical protein I3843_Q020500 [Carya illinoinensis]KAG6688458.1 hypothetical protein I3842_11G126200 [Carya illinoinensis]KAG7956447.1 hypothetical protein I3843_11G124500 [Carya illinoinensis]